jgi:glucose/arabinose dehydrogenase
MPTRALIVIAALVLQLLPQPFETPWYRRPTRVVAMPDGHRLTVPAGFSVNVFADQLQFARLMALAPNGDVFLAEPARNAGTITILRDADHDGTAETRETFATGLNRPFGLALWKDYLYVGNNDSVVRFAYKAGQAKASGEAEKIVDLPGSDAALDEDTAKRLKIDVSQTRGYNHWTRNVIFNRAGTKMYVTVGSATNATPEEPERNVERAASTNTAPTAGPIICLRAACAIRSGSRTFRTATRSGRRSTSAIISATISCRTTSRRFATADSTAGRTRTSANISIRQSARSVRIWWRGHARRTCFCLLTPRRSV